MTFAKLGLAILAIPILIAAALCITAAVIIGLAQAVWIIGSFIAVCLILSFVLFILALLEK